MRHTVQCDVGGKQLTIESGWVAGQADGSVTLRLGETVMLITACMSDKPREGIDFFPLSVDYEERMYSVGRIPDSMDQLRSGQVFETTRAIVKLIDRNVGHDKHVAV